MIFISTGGFKSEKSINSINKLMKKGIYDIELSGGEYEVDQIKKIISEKKLQRKKLHWQKFIRRPIGYRHKRLPCSKLFVNKKFNLPVHFTFCNWFNRL